MFIVWGKKIVRRSEGHTCLFCPMCREIALAQIVHVLRVPHVYFISTSAGEHVMSELVCEQCDSVFPASLSVATWGPDEPGLLKRVEIESRARNSRVESDDREYLLAEAIGALSYECQKEVQVGSAQSVTAVLQVVAVLCLIVCIVLWAMFISETNPSERSALLPWVSSLTALSCILMPLMIYRSMFAGNGVVRKKLLPRIARSLKYLQPTAAEIDKVLGELKADDNAIARALTTQQVMNALELARMEP